MLISFAQCAVNIHRLGHFQKSILVEAQHFLTAKLKQEAELEPNGATRGG